MTGATLQVIVASTRPGRVGLPVARWLAAHARSRGEFTVELVDLAEVDLPFFNEPHHPRLRNYVHVHTQRWSDTIERADAFVFVTPEYNHGFNAVLKNALDYLHHEWRHKPVGFVSYGGVAAGTRATQMLKPVVTVLKMHPVSEAIAIPYVGQLVTSDGEFQPTGAMESSATAMLDELALMNTVLRPLRDRVAA